MALLNESGQQLRVLAFNLANLLQRLRGIHLRSKQIPERLLQRLQPLLAEPAPLQPNLVDPERPVLALRRSQRKRQHILRHNRPAADKRVLSDRAELVHRAERSNGREILDGHMSRQRRRVRQNAPIAHDTVMPDVHVGHQQILRADPCKAAAAHGSTHARADRAADPARVGRHRRGHPHRSDAGHPARPGVDGRRGQREYHGQGPGQRPRRGARGHA